MTLTPQNSEQQPQPNAVALHYVLGEASLGQSTYRPWGASIVAFEKKFADLKAGTGPDDSYYAVLESTWWDERRDVALKPARDFFNGLNPIQRSKLDWHLNALNPPEELWPQAESGMDWATHLAGAAAKTLMKFWEWQTEAVEQANNDIDFQLQLAQTDAKYESNIRNAVAAHEMPTSALDALERVSQARVMAGDVFDLQLRGIVGYCYRDQSTIVMDSQYDESTYVHEKNHLLGTFPYSPLDDAVVEHLALGLQSGNLSTVDPRYREAPFGTYQHKRRLLDTVMSEGRWPVPLMSILEAHIERDPNGEASQRLEDQMNSAFGDTDVKEFLTRQRDSIHQELTDTFPDAQTLDIDSGKDLYADYALDGLALEVHHDSSKKLAAEVFDEAGYLQKYADEAQYDPNVSPHTLLDLRMQAFVTKRYSDRLSADELY